MLSKLAAHKWLGKLVHRKSALKRKCVASRPYLEGVPQTMPPATKYFTQRSPLCGKNSEDVKCELPTFEEPMGKVGGCESTMSALTVWQEGLHVGEAVSVQTETKLEQQTVSHAL